MRTAVKKRAAAEEERQRVPSQVRSVWPPAGDAGAGSLRSEPRTGRKLFASPGETVLRTVCTRGKRADVRGAASWEVV